MSLQLHYKRDFQSCREFWTGWWERPQNTRPALVGALPKPGVDPVPFPWVLGLLKSDIDVFSRQLTAWAETHEFPAETIPGVIVSFGADHFAALLGADLRLDPANRTAWVDHCVTDWDTFPLKVDWNGWIARRTVECIRELRKRFDGKLLVSPTHLQGNLDCLAALRGVQPLLYDLIDAPEKIHRALQQVDVAFTEVVDVLRRECDTAYWGSLNRHQIYQPGFSGLLQSDFSCMVNPEMFAEFIAPSLTHEATTVDYAEYHLDGPGAIVHTEAVCSIEAIKVIQWQPGTPLIDKDWRELHKRIDDLGRGQMFWRPKPDMCRWIRESIRCKNSCIELNARTATEFEEMAGWLR
jgi:hypothetical protein